MNSSISSSSPRPAGADAEWKVVLAILAMLACAEVCLRFGETRLSKDLAHIRGATTVAGALAAPRQPEGPARVLFIGNSSVREGLDNTLFLEKLKSGHGVNADTWFFIPDGGNVDVWYWSWRRYFASAGSRPDWVVLCGGAHHFDDGQIHAEAAGSCFVGWRDSFPYMMETDQGFEGGLEFIASKASLSYASRTRVQRRLADMILPYNRQVVDDIVNAPLLAESRQDSRVAIEGKSERLASLLAEIRSAGIRAVVVAMPNLEPYDVPESRRKAIRESGAAFVDLRTVPGIGAADFHDKLHLDARGARLFTEAFAEAFGPLAGKRD